MSSHSSKRRMAETSVCQAAYIQRPTRIINNRLAINKENYDRKCALIRKTHAEKAATVNTFFTNQMKSMEKCAYNFACEQAIRQQVMLIEQYHAINDREMADELRVVTLEYCNTVSKIFAYWDTMLAVIPEVGEDPEV
jgi:hypothetical protein